MYAEMLSLLGNGSRGGRTRDVEGGESDVEEGGGVAMQSGKLLSAGTSRRRRKGVGRGTERESHTDHEGGEMTKVMGKGLPDRASGDGGRSGSDDTLESRGVSSRQKQANVAAKRPSPMRRAFSVRNRDKKATVKESSPLSSSTEARELSNKSSNSDGKSVETVDFERLEIVNSVPTLPVRSEETTNDQPTRRRRAWSMRTAKDEKKNGRNGTTAAHGDGPEARGVNIPREKVLKDTESMLAEQKAALAALHGTVGISGESMKGTESLQRKFMDRNRPMNRRGSLRAMCTAESAPPPVLSVVQGFTTDAEVTYLGDGAGYLSEDEDQGRWRRSSRQLLGLISGSNKKSRSADQPQTNPESLLAIDVFDTCRCLRVMDGNSMLVEVVPRHLSAEVYNAHNAYAMASQQNLVASTRKYLSDLHRLGYYPHANGSVARIVRVRLRGVTAPRRGQKFHEEAIQFLAEKVEGKKIHVYIYWKDQFDRAVGDVIVHDDRTMVSISMLKAGLSWYSAEYDRGSDLVSVEKDARREKAGIWSLRNPTPPW